MFYRMVSKRLNFLVGTIREKIFNSWLIMRIKWKSLHLVALDFFGIILNNIHIIKSLDSRLGFVENLDKRVDVIFFDVFLCNKYTVTASSSRCISVHFRVGQLFGWTCGR